ncbi:MAG: hypothetical protein AAGF35_03050 [Pseudomonadota bacterium]
MSTNTNSSDRSNDRLRDTVDTLILSEVFLMQASIESAAAIGNGLSSLGKKLVTSAGAVYPEDSLSNTLQHIADEAVEPYKSRFQYLRSLRNRSD